VRKHGNNRQVIRTVCKSNKRKSNVQEKRRESLADISKVLCLRRTQNEGYHIVAWKARRAFLQHTTEYEFHGMAVWCIVSIFFGIFYTKLLTQSRDIFQILLCERLATMELHPLFW
jgi:hypothetical protein